MTLPGLALQILFGCVLGTTLLMVAGTIYNLLTAPRLDRHAGDGTPAEGSREWPLRVSLLVPARNEADNLRILLPLLKEVSYPELEILILDDGSADATASLIAGAGGRIRLIDGMPLPKGWLGKNWACWQLAAEARGEILIFCDADVRVEPRAVAATVAMMRSLRLDALTCLPRQLLGTWSEKAVIPLLLFMPLLAFLPMALISRRPFPALSMGCGQWFAFTRSAYDAIKGHSAVRSLIVEDMALGRLVKAKGLVLGAALSPRLLATRMYADFPSLWAGFSKNLAFLTGTGWLRATAALAAFAAVNILPWLLPLLGFRAWLAPLALWLAVRLLAAAAFREPWTAWLWSPVGALVIPAMAARSWLGYRRGDVRWKGRVLGAAFAKEAEADGGDGPKAVVIGGGFGGLAAAMRLQGRGFSVTLLEKREKTGGRAYRLRERGYTFDMGPSLVTAPAILESAFKAVGRSLSEFTDLSPLDPYYRIHFHDGTHFDYSGDPEAMKARMRAFSEKDADRYDAFMEAIRPIYEEVLEKGLGSTPFCDWRVMARFLPKALRLKAFLPVAVFVNGFFRDFRHRFIFSFHPLYIGGDPFRAPSVYLMIPYLERKQGVWYAPGGMYSLVEAMERAFLEAGGTLLTERPATRIRIAHGKAAGVETEAGFLPADLVVSNADLAYTYSRLVDPEHRKVWTQPKIDRLGHTMGCFLLFLGVRKTFPKLKHHTLILSERYRELIRDIFRRKILPDDFSLYLHAPCKSDPAMAPPGCESLMVLAPVANLDSGLDWEAAKAGFAEKLIAFLEAWGLDDLKAHIEYQRIYTPLEFRSDFNAVRGNAFGLEPKLSQTGWFRPHNRSEDIPNLYFVGAGTHPGAGVPGVLLSAEAAEACILEDFPLMRARTRAGADARADAEVKDVKAMDPAPRRRAEVTL
jgi:phytoene desaturase